ncbi:helix-turn-helix transcriptional regulator [Paenibacillus silvae]|uniref:HTH araC/xylS-type domain-containing protein n=1 Tax=Paenibacillus silvae TaxID=1325358 RepID=A0A2W6NDE0_9BACL|nr:helix-turn-helix transcriptional regulator [Paenibacillus silvae]PZT53791.1 hypothetical protein DN757_20270 [Paenibacillus silvae]
MSESFEDVHYYFSRRFKQLTGISPRSYRQTFDIEGARLYGVGEHIERVEVTQVENGEMMQLDIDEIVVCHEYDRDFGQLVQWGLGQDDYGIRVDARMRTSAPGIFGAVNSAKTFLDPSAPNMAGVSSHNARFFNKNKAFNKL